MDDIVISRESLDLLLSSISVLSDFSHVKYLSNMEAYLESIYLNAGKVEALSLLGLIDDATFNDYCNRLSASHYAWCKKRTDMRRYERCNHEEK